MRCVMMADDGLYFCKPSTVKKFVQIAQSDALAIEQILLPTTAIGATCDLNLREGEIEESIVIRDAERNLSEAELPPLLGAGDPLRADQRRSQAGLAHADQGRVDRLVRAALRGERDARLNRQARRTDVRVDAIGGAR